jgi:transposase
MPFVSVREPILLSDEDLAYLEHLTRSRTTRKDLHERATIVLLSHHGRSDSAIARELGIPRQKVIRTINRVLTIGVREGLKDLPGRGRPKTISPEARTWIVDLFCRKPVEFGYPHEVWTQRLLQQHIREHAVEEGFPEVAQISQGTISKLANASAIKPHKIRSYVQNRDPAFHEKAIVVLHTYEEANILKVLEKEGNEPDTFILSFDEKSGVQVRDTNYPDLMPVPGQFPCIHRDYEYVRHGTVCLQAALDLVTGFVHYRITERNRSEEFIEFLKMLDAQYPDRMKLKIILDNLKVHSSVETMKYLKTVPNRFEFIFTPKHASWLNIIETFFSKTTRTVLRGIRAKSKEEITERISRYIDTLNQAPVVFKWSYTMDANPSGVEMV